MNGKVGGAENLGEAYDASNVFAKIIRGEIPCKKVMETRHALSFFDNAPTAPIHILVIPKGPYTTFETFLKFASPNEQTDFFQCVRETLAWTRGQYGASSFQFLSNAGADAGQTVHHFHLHVQSGQKILD